MRAIPARVVQQLVVAGLPSSGKTSTIAWLVRQARQAGPRPGYARVHCHPGLEEEPPAASTPARTWVSDSDCPDHYLAVQLAELQAWATTQAVTLLVVETAGLCARCSPFPPGAASVFVADLTMGRSAIQKVGPMLTTADVCVLTRIDRVSWTEACMQHQIVERANPECDVVMLNGLTGEGQEQLWRKVSRHLAAAPEPDRAERAPLRSPPPQFYCSYCLGQKRVGIFDQ